MQQRNSSLRKSQELLAQRMAAPAGLVRVGGWHSRGCFSMQDVTCCMHSILCAFSSGWESLALCMAASAGVVCCQ